MKKIVYFFILSFVLFYANKNVFAYSQPTKNEIRRALLRATSGFTVSQTINTNLSGYLAENNYTFSPIMQATEIKSCKKESNRPGYICVVRIAGNLMARNPGGFNSYMFAPMFMDAKGRFFVDGSTGSWMVSYLNPIKLWSPVFDCTGTSFCKVKYNLPDIKTIQNKLPSDYLVYRNVGIREAFSPYKIYKVSSCSRNISGINCTAIMKGLFTEKHVSLSMTSQSLNSPTKTYEVLAKQPINISKSLTTNEYNIRINGIMSIVYNYSISANNKLKFNPMSVDTDFSKVINAEATIHKKNFAKFILGKYKNKLKPNVTTENEAIKILGEPAYIIKDSYIYKNKKYNYLQLQYQNDTANDAIIFYFNIKTKKFAGYNSKYFNPATKNFNFGAETEIGEINKNLS